MNISDGIAFVAAIIAVGSAWFAWGSWREAKRSADASVRSAKAAEDTVTLTREEHESANRARLTIYEPSYEPERPGEGILGFRVRNSGRASAQGVRLTLSGDVTISEDLLWREMPKTMAPDDDLEFAYRVIFPSGDDAPSSEFQAMVAFEDRTRDGGSAVLWWSIPGTWEHQLSMEGMEFRILENGREVRSWDSSEMHEP